MTSRPSKPGAASSAELCGSADLSAGVGEARAHRYPSLTRQSASVAQSNILPDYAIVEPALAARRRGPDPRRSRRGAARPLAGVGEVGRDDVEYGPQRDVQVFTMESGCTGGRLQTSGGGQSEGCEHLISHVAVEPLGPGAVTHAWPDVHPVEGHGAWSPNVEPPAPVTPPSAGGAGEVPPPQPSSKSTATTAARARPTQHMTTMGR
jgi:hypothetical protein